MSEKLSLINLDRAAEVVGISTHQVRRLINKYDLPVINFGHPGLRGGKKAFKLAPATIEVLKEIVGLRSLIERQAVATRFASWQRNRGVV